MGRGIRDQDDGSKGWDCRGLSPLLTVLPPLALVPEIARRPAGLLRVARGSDPFTGTTARSLVTLGELTAFARFAYG